ncbi:unnamed protein product [Camellia sinensis]
MGFNPKPIRGLRIFNSSIRNRTTDSKNLSKPIGLDWIGSDYGFHRFLAQPYLGAKQDMIEKDRQKPVQRTINSIVACLAIQSLFEMGWKAAQKLIHHWKILRGDNVKKHIKQGQGHEGGIFTVEAPLHVSNVQVLDPVTGRPCKVGIRYLEDGAKARVSRGIGTSGSIIPRPEILKIRTTPRPTVALKKVFFICEQI